MSALPPMGGVAPPLQCNRLTGGTLGAGDEQHCGREGKWHLIWTSDLENGICCEEHYQEARERWGFYAVHEYQPDCSMPGAVYLYLSNRCVVDEDELVATESAGGRHTVRALPQEVWSDPDWRELMATPSLDLVSAASTYSTQDSERAVVGL